MSLTESRLYKFIDAKNGFTLSFLEGQKLIHDLALIHDLKRQGFSYFRDCVLGVQPMISFLKTGEGFGLFVDSEFPYFRLKIETNSHGMMRTLLLPENFEQFPDRITGKARLSKTFPNNPQPYTSIIELADINFGDITNKIMRESYQVNAETFLSDTSDQSVLLLRLPDRNVNKEEKEERPTLKEYWMQIQAKINTIFDKALNDYETIQKEFEALGLEFLGATDVQFKCSCSRERMVAGVASLCMSHSVEEIFENKDDLEAKCDYCKTHYLITKEEVESATKLN
ncbi:chaperonin HslO [Bacteriovorax sp. BSW11_IV]|uniref:Hsp33 family molecular chaperone HslO n=1 Tax=Bacteriovorax sp. BSW11_IV TaxID=1353529 RepID=UPI00038A3E0F|nr:Hsp33 family molecular chaperone HslO [Bacteriovorax sp. BSW11_IV]EQC48346.1 chaperonin HslO [Bacteriovorax sp. BSW11_IV]